jgi:Icc protein
MDDKPLRLIQLSDLHLFEQMTTTLLRVKTEQSFEELLKLIKKDSFEKDFVVISGDLAQDASVEAYHRIAKQIAMLNVPVYYVPGNHDEPKTLSSVYPLNNILKQKSILSAHWQIILLDTHKPNAVAGYLAEDELLFLQSSLEKYPKHHALIVLHHQPVPVNSTWLDKIGLLNADELWAMLAKYPQVRSILFGHIHHVHEGHKNGISYYSTPSTCIQFKPNSEDFALDNIPPGYRWVELFATGEIKTGIRRLPHYVGTFDADARGY